MKINKEMFDELVSKKGFIELINNYDLTNNQAKYLIEISNEQSKNNMKYIIDTLLIKKVFPLSFIERHKDKLNWDIVSYYQILSEKFINKFSNKVNWRLVSGYQKLSESFMEKYLDLIDWEMVSISQKLSESFIEKYSDKVVWEYIAMFQKLSESFIEKHLEQLPVSTLLKYQRLSESFLEKHSELLNNGNNKDNIIFYQNYSDNFAKKYNLLKSFVGNLKTYRNPKRAIKASKKYECFNNYFIGYKAVRKDRYSFMNFQYKYLPNTVYESNCDCTSDVNSFGFNVTTYKAAKKLLENRSGLIIKCKVHYKDVGSIVCGEDKIRCFKLEVLK